MADEKKNDNEGELELDGSGKKKKLIIIIAVVVLLAAGGGGYFFFMGGSDDAVAQVEGSAEGSGENESAEQSAEMGTALYVPMPRAFTFHVPGASRDRLVEIKVQLLVRGSDNEDVAKMHVPLIENTLTRVFSQANADDLATTVGKASLKKQALIAVQNEMKDIEDNETIEQVLFTGFVMQ